MQNEDKGVGGQADRPKESDGSSQRKAREGSEPNKVSDTSPALIRHKLQNVIKGDPQAGSWLYDTFAGRLFRRLRQRYGYAGGLDPEDLLQDAFFFYFRNDGKVLQDFLEQVPATAQTERALERRLWDLACGLATNQRRSDNLRKFVPLTELGGTPSSGYDTERDTLGRDTLARLDACLQQKGSRIYLYYKLRYRDGFLPAEISNATGWSTKTTYKLKQSLNEALLQCAKRLKLDIVTE